ncbi:hypothetical protein C0J52_00337 [Blattella germanica]|nr:hypothetical protein C0J52_00337 [Blattella germanica]
MICARAHKNIGYALHFLQLANQSLHKENTSQNAEDQIHKKNHSNFMYKAIILLEAADGNLRMLFKHLRTKTKEDIEGGKRRGRKRRGYSGAGPRSLVLKGNMTDGRNLGQKLFHTLSFNRTRQFFLETKPQNQLYLANHSSKKQEEVPVQEIEILALLSKVDGLGRFLQEIHDNYTNKRGSKEIIAKEIETLVFLLKAHKQLCEIITKMNIILASLERDRRIKKEMDIFIGEPISVKSNKITKQKQDENLTKVKTDKAKVDIAQSMRDSKNKQDKKQLNEKVNVKLSETDDSEGENLK